MVNSLLHTFHHILGFNVTNLINKLASCYYVRKVDQIHQKRKVDQISFTLINKPPLIFPFPQLL